MACASVAGAAGAVVAAASFADVFGAAAAAAADVFGTEQNQTKKTNWIHLRKPPSPPAAFAHVLMTYCS